MKRTLLWLMMALLLFAVSGCGGGNDEPRFVQKTILSDPDVDGDILDSAGIRTVSLVTRDGLSAIRAGLVPGSSDEYRAFIDFPLTVIPLNAVIQSATLSIVIRSVTVVPPTATIPIRIELVSFDPFLTPPLIGNYFDRAILLPLATTTIVPPISSTDVNREVNIDVTSLMVEAQRRGEPDFQVRLLEDFGVVTPGLVEIDESSDANAPQLTVVYF
ncbi:MAG TPA: hypothetical protein DCZ75_08490 [Geobacter sp.]|nr:hypothetical protein [Geobacter sp.]